MKKNIISINAIALLITIIISYLSNASLLNGESMGSISAKYHSLFTPSGYAFSIWGIIYLGLFAFVIYTGITNKNLAQNKKVTNQIGWLFAFSSLLNSLWVITWIYEYTAFSVVLMLLLFVVLFKITLMLSTVKSENWQTKLFIQSPFYLYSGWISVALIANIASYLVKINWNGFGISATIWALLMIAIAAIIHLLVLWKKNLPVFSFVAVWALLAIGNVNHTVNDTVYWMAIGSASFIGINIIINFFRQKSIK